jgi:hypothetical protein
MPRLDDAADARATVPQEVDRRGEPRNLGGEHAELVFGTSALDCTVLDRSTNGARVRLNSAAVVPEQLVLRFERGDAFVARRLWTLREQIGLLFDSSSPLNQGSAPVALAAFEALPVNGLDDALHILRVAGFLDNVALSEAAREAEAAYARFRDVLRRLVNQTS